MSGNNRRGSRVEDDVKDMHARLKDTEKDIKHLFNLSKDGWDAQCTLAKLAATTARDVNEVKSNHKLVCFLSGELKKSIVTKFDAFKKAASEARAKAKEDAAKSGAAAKAASASHPTGALAAAAGGSADAVDALTAQASHCAGIDVSVNRHAPALRVGDAARRVRWGRRRWGRRRWRVRVGIIF